VLLSCSVAYRSIACLVVRLSIAAAYYNTTHSEPHSPHRHYLSQPPLTTTNTTITNKKGTLGAINPFPWAVALMNTFAWLLYSVLIADHYLQASVTSGVVSNFYAVQSAFYLIGVNEKEGRYIP
jgi:hypothetical protein